MREIKFRAWYQNEKRMIGWNEMQDNTWESLDTYFRGVFADVSPLMQYTELKDINGKDIYEGDIVLMDIGDVQNNKTLKITDEQRQEVFKRDLKIISFQNGSFGFYPVFPDLNYIDDREWCPFLDRDGELWSRYMKVIGNIYENHELLK